MCKFYKAEILLNSVHIEKWKGVGEETCFVCALENFVGFYGNIFQDF